MLNGMTSYRLDCSLDANIPDSDNGGTICLWNGTNIHFKDEWKASITVEGRMKKLSGIDLREELDSRENVSVMSGQDGDEVFGE